MVPEAGGSSPLAHPTRPPHGGSAPGRRCCPAPLEASLDADRGRPRFVFLAGALDPDPAAHAGLVVDADRDADIEALGGTVGPGARCLPDPVDLDPQPALR